MGFLLVKQTELGNASIKDRLENKRRLLVELNSELLKKIGDFNPKIFEEENINKQTDALLETAGEASTRGFKLGHFTSKAWDFFKRAKVDGALKQVNKVANLINTITEIKEKIEKQIADIADLEKDQQELEINESKSESTDLFDEEKLAKDEDNAESTIYSLVEGVNNNSIPIPPAPMPEDFKPSKNTIKGFSGTGVSIQDGFNNLKKVVEKEEKENNVDSNVTKGAITLLEEIRRGTKLKKVSPEDVEKEKSLSQKSDPTTVALWNKAGEMAEELEAIRKRRESIEGNDDESQEWEDDEEENKRSAEFEKKIKEDKLLKASDKKALLALNKAVSTRRRKRPKKGGEKKKKKKKKKYSALI